MSKARIDIVSKREITDKFVIDANIEIKGIIKRERFLIDKTVKESEINDIVIKEVKKNYEKSVVGQTLEVDL